VGIDWGQALAAGLATGAQAGVNQLSADADEQRWLDKEKQLQAAETERQHSLALFTAQLKPPETRKVNVTGTNGQPAIQQQESQIDPTSQKAGWVDVGDQTPDINFERLDETTRHNQETESLRSAADQARAEGNAAKLEATYARIAAENARHEGTTAGNKPSELITTDPTTNEPIRKYGFYDKDHNFIPAKDEAGNPMQGPAFQPSVWEQKRSAAAQGVKGTLHQISDALGLGELTSVLSGNGPTAPAARGPGNAPPPNPKAGGGGSAPGGMRQPPTMTQNDASVQRNGGAGTPFQEGQTIYDKSGRAYKVVNGQPVAIQ
jgi:hypothetical protein